MLTLLLAASLAAGQADASWGVPTAHAAGLLGTMRLAESALWPSSFDPTRLDAAGDNLRVAFTRPPELRRDRMLLESDGDPWAINVVGHGLFGSEVYLRFRQCGHGTLAALGATALVSTIWEYAVEGPYKRPSAIDLAWTPLVGGLVLGEARVAIWRWAEAGWLRALVDPLGSLERAAGSGC